MNLLTRLGSTVFLFSTAGLLSAVACPASAQPLSPQQEVSIKADVNRAFDQYRERFAADRADLVAERVNIPWLRLQPTGPVTFSSRHEVKTFFEGTLRPLMADGYAKSEWPTLTTCVVNEGTAIVSGRYIRYRKDGSVIGEYGTTYVFAKTTDGWRIVSTIPHDPHKLVLCSQ